MSEVAEVPARRTRETRKEGDDRAGLWRLADIGLIVGFLALTFLLGIFPLKDTDFWWHLRTGDLIRQTGKLPTVDTYTFGAEGHRWVDLHWIFQVLISVGYEKFGVPGLNLAKCVVTCLGVGLLITARRKDWPVWALLLAWVPGLLVLSGRMYVRPETLTFLYIAAYLAILFRIDERPKLALALPIVQVAWVNTQGLFVFGPALFGAALVGAALRPGAFAAGRRGWWRTVLIAIGLVGLACLINPYGLAGALYPLQLAGTMSNDIFSKSIAELKSLDDLIKETGLTLPPLQIHLATMVLGVLSFLIPMLWRMGSRATQPAAAKVATKPSRKRKAEPEPVKPRILPDFWRLILFGVFTALSWKATRNSHQFGAVVGAITAWNLAEWAGEVASARAAKGKRNAPALGRLITFATVAGLIVAVGSGAFYSWTAEGRTVGLGEEPHWYPHEAVAFAGRADMPPRSICFHDGHAALYEYAYAPDRKTYADARLEVMGPALYRDYIALERKISTAAPGWEAELDAMGRPVILVDNVHATLASVSATLLASRRYRCVWFDEVAALFVHEAYAGVVNAHAVDFGKRHFGGEDWPTLDTTAQTMLAKTSWNLLHSLLSRPTPRGLSRLLVWTGLDRTRAVIEAEPNGFDGWKWAGMIEFYREPPTAGDPIPRYRMPFDPVFDLSAVRASYALRKALMARPDDGNALVTLGSLDLQRGMYESSLSLFDRYLARPVTSSGQAASRQATELQRTSLAQRVGTPPASMKWDNLAGLDALVSTLNAQGRVTSVADLYESAFPEAGRPWPITDAVATIRLHLGEPDRAFALWSHAKNPPDESVRQARMAAARFAMGDFDGARIAYREAIRLAPKNFEALYGLAVLESDLGHAADAMTAARGATSVAPNSAAKTACEALIESLAPYVLE